MPLRRASHITGHGNQRISPLRRLARFAWTWGLPGLLLFLALSKVVEWETERWWFQGLRLQTVYGELIVWRLGAFAIAFAAFALLLGLNARVAWLVAEQSAAPLGWGELWENEGGSRLIPLEDKLGLDRYRNQATVITVGIVSWLAGLAAATNFELWLHAAHATATGVKDELWGRDLGFYLFQLPALSSLNSFIFWALAISLILATAIYIYEESIELGGRRAYIAPGAMRHLAALFAAIIAWKSFGWHLDTLDIQSAGSLTGITQPYFFGNTAAHYRLPALQTASCLAPLIAVVMLSLAHRDKGRASAFLGAGFYLGAWAATSVLPLWVQTNQNTEVHLSQEDTYLDKHIEATKSAWGLAKSEVSALSTTGELPRDVVTAAQEQLPVWPKAAVRRELNRRLRAANSQLQVTNIQLERWRVDGTPRQTYICVLQTQPAFLATGGSGSLATPGIAIVDARATDAEKSLLIYAAPVLAPRPVHTLAPESAPDIKLDSPILRLEFGAWNSVPAFETFGEYQGTPRSREERDDIPLRMAVDLVPATDSTFAVPTENVWQRFLVNWRFLRTSLGGGQSTMHWHRRVVDRCRQIAPFLRWDHAAPRLILAADNRPVWMLDAFATSRRYPNASGPGLLGAPFTDANYGRHVVTATVDALTGEVTLYLLNPDEPFSKLYKSAFPGLFHRFQEMPNAVRQQWRPSQALFAARAAVWSRIHQAQDTQEWLSRRKTWRPAFDPYGWRDGNFTFRAWAPADLIPNHAAGNVQLAAYQSNPQSASSMPIKLTGMLLGPDVQLTTPGNALPPLWHWSPSGDIALDKKIIGDRETRNRDQSGIYTPPVLLTSALPIGGGVTVATGKMESQTRKRKKIEETYTTLEITGGEILPDGVRTITPPPGVKQDSQAETRLKTAREALRQWEAAQREGKWANVAAARRRLKAALEALQ